MDMNLLGSNGMPTVPQPSLEQLRQSGNAHPVNTTSVQTTDMSGVAMSTGIAAGVIPGMPNGVGNMFNSVSTNIPMDLNTSHNANIPTAMPTSMPPGYGTPMGHMVPQTEGTPGLGFPTMPGATPQVAGRCNGLEYANMRKEKAREEYKEKRRLELVASGDVDRTKRRKKNDPTMTENQKYHRRLKMNQDSAAAARHAQDVYVHTLEKLVETTEAEKSVLSIQAMNLRSERDDLARRVHVLQHKLSAAQVQNRPTEGTVVEESPAQGTVPHHASTQGQEGNADANAHTNVIFKKMLEIMDAPSNGTPADFSRNIVGIHPAPAV